MPPITLKTTNGPSHAVPCPHCGKDNDLRGSVETYGDKLVGEARFACDHCHQLFEVVRSTPVTVYTVRQYVPRAGGAPAIQQQAAPVARAGGNAIAIRGPGGRPILVRKR